MAGSNRFSSLRRWLLEPLYARLSEHLRSEMHAEMRRQVHNIHLFHLDFHDQLGRAIGNEFLKMHDEIEGIRHRHSSELLNSLEAIRSEIEQLRNARHSDGLAAELRRIAALLESLSDELARRP